MTVETLFPAAKERLVSISNTAPLTEAAARLGSGHVDLIAVCDKSGIIAGVISKTDIVSRISQCRGDACAIMASSVMSKNIVYCRRSDSLRSVWNLIKQNGVLHLPVVDDDLRPVGMIYARDVLQTLLQEAKHEKDLLRDYVNGVGYH